MGTQAPLQILAESPTASLSTSGESHPTLQVSALSSPPWHPCQTTVSLHCLCIIVETLPRRPISTKMSWCDVWVAELCCWRRHTCTHSHLLAWAHTHILTINNPCCMTLSHASPCAGIVSGNTFTGTRQGVYINGGNDNIVISDNSFTR
jgi:hypothetical protein